METHLFDRGAMENRNQSYTLNQDKQAGLKSSVNNGQVRLALEYAQSIIIDLVARVSELEEKISSAASDSVKVENAEPKKVARTTKPSAKTEQSAAE